MDIYNQLTQIEEKIDFKPQPEQLGVSELQKNDFPQSLQTDFGVVSKLTMDYINTVTSPFSIETPTRRPDGVDQQTFLFKDFNSVSGLGVVFSNNDSGGNDETPGKVIGVFLVLLPPNNLLSVDSQLLDTTATWSTAIIGINEDNKLISSTDASVTYYNLPGVNQTKITDESALLRNLSYGMRIESNLGVTTSIISKGVSTMYGGQITVSNLVSEYLTGIVDSNQSLSSLVNNDPKVKKFSNVIGVSSRLDTWQNETYSYFLDSEQLTNNVYNWDSMYMPYVIVYFQGAQTGTLADANQSFISTCLNFNTIYYFESVLMYPTHLIPKNTFKDPNFQQTIELIKGMDTLYPVVAERHSFKIPNLKLFLKHLKICGATSSLL